jgi:Tfp pilus assembly protein PilX
MIVNSAKEPERRGFILASAVFALLLIAALVAGVFFASTEATRMGVAAADRQFALFAAESAVEGAMVSWSSAGSRVVAIGQTLTTTDRVSGMPVSGYLTRVDSVLFWIVADAGPPHPGSGVRSRIGAFVRARTAADGSTSLDRISERWWSELF